MKMGILYSSLFSSLRSLLLLVIFTSQLANAENNTQNFHYFCDTNHRGNYTTNSTYATNLNTLLSTLTSNTEITYGFYNVSQGQNTNKINAIGLCRGDIKPNECRSCLTSSKANLTQLCPNQKEAIGWFENELCMLRYSDRSIFNLMENGPAYFAWNRNNATNEYAFNQVVKNLLDGLRSRAILGDSRVKFSTASEVGVDNQTVYGLMQCTPDLSRARCDDCLVQSISEIHHCCESKVGARIIRPSCSVRYETNSLFYEPMVASPSPSPSPSPLPLVPPPSFGQNTSSEASPSPSPSPLPLAPPPSFGKNTSSEDKGKTSKTTVSAVPLLLVLLYSFLSVSL